MQRPSYRRYGRVGQDEFDPLINERPPRRSGKGGFIAVSALAAIIVVAALSIGIAALIRTFDSAPNEHVNHGQVPDIGDKWLYFGRDLTNGHHSERSLINSQNAASLVEKFKVQIGQDPSLGGTIAGAVRADINWGSVTVDDQYIFLATHNQRNEAGTVLDQTGYIMAFNRATGARVWNKAVTSYSLDNLAAQAGSKFEAAPAVWGDYLYIGSKNNRPQSYASTAYQAITNPTFSGFPATGKARRTHVYCINKHTGAEVWATEIGAVATNFGETDNLLAIAMSPVVFEMDPAGGSNKIPVVAVGTTSGNSFVPAFSGSDEATAKGYQAISGYAGLGTDPNTRMTDTGRLVLFNGLTGAVLSTTMMGPAHYAAGDTLSSESIVYGDGDRPFDMEIWHIVQAADIAGAGELNPIQKSYRHSKMIISIMPGATIAAASPLVGLAVTDNTGANHIIAAGAAPANLDYVTVVMEVEFVPGTTNFYRHAPQPSATPFDTTTADLDGALGNVPARIVKGLKVGDVLTDQDAYECNYYGASVWGSSPSVNFDKNGVPTELYVATGQAHKIPYDETKRFVNSNPPGQGATPIERLWGVKQAQVAFDADKTQPNLDAVRQANADRLRDLEDAKKIPVSVRGRRMLNNAVIAINLRPGKIGEIMWSRKAVGYDTWKIDLLNDQQRQNEGGNLPGFTSAEAHHGMLRGHDADHGEAPYYCPNCGEYGADYIVAPNKGGTVTVLKLSDVNNGPTVPTEEIASILDNPGLLGGSNYGSVLRHKTKRLYTVQSNEAAAFVTTVDRPFNQRSLAPPMEWFPLNEHDPATIVPFTHRQSFLSCYNFLNNSVDWEVPLQTVAPGNNYATVTAFSGGADLIYVQPNSLTLQIRKAADGSLVHSIALDSAGVSAHAILDREIIIANGRAGFLGDNPAGTNYKAAKYVYKFGLP